MFVKSIDSTTVNRFGKFCKVRTDYGKYKDYHIAIEHYYQNNKEIEKLYVIWNKWMQMIVPKARNNNGKFDRIG